MNTICKHTSIYEYLNFCAHFDCNDATKKPQLFYTEWLSSTKFLKSNMTVFVIMFSLLLKLMSVTRVKPTQKPNQYQIHSCHFFVSSRRST